MKRFFVTLIALVMLPAAAFAVPITAGSSQDAQSAGVFTFNANNLTGVNAFAFEFTNSGTPLLLTATYTLDIGNDDVEGAALSFSNQDDTGSFFPQANPTTFASPGTVDRATRRGAGNGLLRGDPLTGSLTFLLGTGESIFVNAGLNTVNPANLTVTIMSQIPLPASVLLLLSALSGLGFISYRRKSVAA